jgi:hypothetical protein
MTSAEQGATIIRIAGQFFGALLITFILTRLTNKFFRGKYGYKRAAIISFFLVAVLALTIGSYTMGFVESLIFYVPCLLVWLIMDLIASRKTW